MILKIVSPPEADAPWARDFDIRYSDLLKLYGTYIYYFFSGCVDFFGGDS
jgi:hypothetical protein